MRSFKIAIAILVSSICLAQTNNNGAIQQITSVTPLFSQTNRVTVNSAGAQTITGTGAGTVTLPANFFGVAGNTLRFFINGIVSVSSTSTVLTVRVTLGGTVLCLVAQSPTVSDSNAGFTIDGYLTANTTGTSGTIACGGRVDLEQQVSPFALSGGLTTGASPVTINTTLTQVFDVTVSWGTFASGDTLTSVVYVLTSS